MGSWRFPFRRSMFDVEPLWGSQLTWPVALAVDITESDKAYEVTVELPGIDEKNIEVEVANDNLIIKGEKQEENEAKKKDYYLSERHFGSFERRFRLPEGSRCGQDRGKLQEGFAYGYSAEKAGGTETGKED